MSPRNLLIAALSAVAVAHPFEGVESRQACVAMYGQCGGTGYSGATCCVEGATCVESNEYYSQCLAGSGSGTTSSVKSTTTVSASKTTVTASVTTSRASVGSGTATYSGNPFAGVTQWANNFYKSEVSASAVPTFGAKATAVAEVPSFLWLDSLEKVQSSLEDTLTDIQTANAAGGNNVGLFVIYDLPDRDCAAAASNGEYTVQDNGVALYEAYIDTIYALFVKYSDVRVNLVIEPDSLANLVTNLDVAECAAAESAYLTCINYALTKFNLANVAMYIDAGHAGWLGWSANIGPAATLFASVYKNASEPASLRGLATNVANYNAWEITTCPSYTSGDQVCDESGYIGLLGPELTSAGWPNAKFITDTSRNGMQPTGQLAWGDWCNVIDTGFGTRPSSDTSNDLLDAFVWVKPGGECDGTSNTTAPRYDYHCGLADALQPSPQAGAWFEAYFEQLYNNANPAFS
ncbi:carbohydrate-binding module family 1 [Xylariaceae sp. FL0255]|nr:carbohydrate-binding module family 1 [Xylariaceae sp. FL0255]